MRTLVIAPGRGSYGRSSLGSLQNLTGEAADIVAACDTYRASQGLPTVTELDAEPTFRGTRHVAGEHASLLTFASSLVDLSKLNRDKHEIVGVVGNSMGFYTALAATGALPLEDAIRLVDTMGSYQKGNVIGGQILYPITNLNWEPDDSLSAAVDEALAQVAGAYLSIRLGSYVVLGGTSTACKELLAILPKESRGSKEFPLQLPLHSAFHTPLLSDAAQQAVAELGDLRFAAPNLPLINGFGMVYRPLHTHPATLSHYTLGPQVKDTFDYTVAIRSALRHCGPELVVTLGPGNSLGGPTAAIMVQEGWMGSRSRAEFEEAQKTNPTLLSFGITKQQESLV